MVSRLATTMCAIGALALTSCEGSPTQPTPIAPAPPPAPPPAANQAPWMGFIGNEADGFKQLTGLPAMTQSFPAAINEAGQVVGEVALGLSRRAFIWSPGSGMEDLG